MAELYSFFDNGVYHNFTPTLFSKVLSGQTYTPAIINRSAINITNNFAKSDVVFTFDRLNSFANSLIYSLPETPIIVTIYKDGASYWKGRVLNAKKGMVSIAVSCDSKYVATISGGRRYRTTLYCNHTLYSPQCGVVQSSWQTVRTATATSTLITLGGGAVTDSQFIGGIAEMGGQKRRIVTNTTSSITLASPFVGNLSGNIYLYPGCALTEAACTAFGNLDNGLMFDHLPTRNPMDKEGML